MIHLIGPANEAAVIVEGVQTMALVNTGAQVSTIAKRICRQLGLKVYKMKRMICLKGMEQFTAPYLGYVEVEIKIPAMWDYKENALMLFIPDSH